MNENEDKNLNHLIKSALESRGAFQLRIPKKRLAHRWLRWTIPSLLAASLAIVALFRTMLSPSPIYSLTDTIEFLSAVDEIDLDETALNSPTELLLAWQDIPYTAIADEQTAE